ncbi:MAG TPA: carbon storage regulator [Pirellulales bacterium]
MLVLTRRIGEEVIIGESIRVQILEVQGNRVKLGLTAPDDVRFKRGELADALRRCPSVVGAGCEPAETP